MLITGEMEKEAAANPGGWVYKIDWKFAANQYVPPEAIVGAYKVDDNGKITGEFVKNDAHVPVVKAIRKPREYMHRALSAHVRDQWVVEIDPDYDTYFPDVPIEGQIGRWYISADGVYTGDFRPNPLYKGEIKT